MNSKNRSIRALTIAGSVVLMVAVVLLAGRGRGEASTAPPAADSPVIQVSFKLDSRLTRSLYMGERWVSPPTYQHATQVGDSATLEAMAQLVDTKGRPFAASPTWTPGDPEMLAVSPRGNQVTITVRRAGQSRLKLAQGGVSKELTVKAVHQDGSWRVDVLQ